jgi:hypothetical protein
VAAGRCANGPLHHPTKAAAEPRPPQSAGGGYAATQHTGGRRVGGVQVDWRSPDGEDLREEEPSGRSPGLARAWNTTEVRKSFAPGDQWASPRHRHRWMATVGRWTSPTNAHEPVPLGHRERLELLARLRWPPVIDCSYTSDFSPRPTRRPRRRPSNGTGPRRIQTPSGRSKQSRDMALMRAPSAVTWGTNARVVTVGPHSRVTYGCGRAGPFSSSYSRQGEVSCYLATRRWAGR